MCGIAGIIQSSSGRSLTDIQRMTAALAHRGPDAEHYWSSKDGSVFLGHRRLCVIDLSENARQPMQFHDRFTIVYNGEIYNYKEVREALIQEGHQFTTQSDTEVILAAYLHYDDECVNHFDGMFAFAIWDEENKELFAARDRFGEKPFYYYHENGQFIFASEMKSLWQARIPRQPNMKMLFNFITIGYADNPEKPEETFYSNISKLPAASRLFYNLSDDDLFIEQYWSINPESPEINISERDAIDQFTHLFSNSIKKRLRSDVSIGTSLSGGLDSSAIVAMINEVTDQSSSYTSSAFTASFPGFEKDESAYAAAITKKFNLHHHLIHVNGDDMVDDWDNFIYHQEEPVGSASAYVQYKVFQLAKANGVTVLLDGQGADETLAGYHKYYKWYWQELFRKRKLIKTKEVHHAHELGVKEQFGIRNMIAALFPDIAANVLENQYLSHALRHTGLTKEFVHLQSQEAYYTVPSIFDLNGALHFNTFTHGLEELLRYADRNAMAHGCEVRLPFLDHKLVEFLFSLPSSFKINQGRNKYLLRQCMDKRLPAEITWRKDKTGFEPPQKQWMQNSRMMERITEAKKKLAENKILTGAAALEPPVPHSAYAKESKDWRYLSAATVL